MKTIQDVVDHYLPKKKAGEISISEIRKELNENSDFSEVEINSICMNISDRELSSLGEKKMWKLDFLKNIYFSIFMILATIAIFTFSFVRFNKLQTLSKEGTEINDIDLFLPGFFLLASIIYMVRHVFRLIKAIGKNKS